MAAYGWFWGVVEVMAVCSDWAMSEAEILALDRELWLKPGQGALFLRHAEGLKLFQRRPDGSIFSARLAKDMAAMDADRIAKSMAGKRSAELRALQQPAATALQRSCNSPLEVCSNINKVSNKVSNNAVGTDLDGKDPELSDPTLVAGFQSRVDQDKARCLLEEYGRVAFREAIDAAARLPGTHHIGWYEERLSKRARGSPAQVVERAQNIPRAQDVIEADRRRLAEAAAKLGQNQQEVT